MLEARLFVERGALKDQSEEWGRYVFLALPSPADRISVARDDQLHFLTVLSVHHEPVPVGEGGTPAALVVARWTGSR